MSMPPVVYLDSQDYSRFGDVLRGKQTVEMEALFLELERRKQNGEVIFAVSMPLLSELLQYNSDFRDTTMKKAEAVERLCGSWALAYPSRLIGIEIARVACESLSFDTSPELSPLSNDRYWYPNIAEIFADISKNSEDRMNKKMADLPAPKNRHERLARKSVLAKFNLPKAVRQIVPEFAEKYGIPRSAVERAVVELMRGNVSPEQASRAFFRDICEPSTFVEIYFERVESQRSLPSWLSEVGERMKRELEKFKNIVTPFLDDEELMEQVRQAIRDKRHDLGRELVSAGLEDVEEFGLARAQAEIVLANLNLLEKIPSYQIAGAVTEAYTNQVLGLQGSAAKIERSFAGDFMHSIYLPHVDLWRSDRRFSDVVRKALPYYSSRIVSAPSDLLAAIDMFHRRATIV